MEPNAPPDWLIFVAFTAAVGLLLGVMIVVAGVKRKLRGESFWAHDSESGARASNVRSRTLHRRPAGMLQPSRPQRRNVPARNAAQLSSGAVSASERAVSGDRSVPIVPVSVAEAAVIGKRLGEGMSPSDVAKSLPGYSARNYKEYAEKVRLVKGELDKAEVPRPAAQDEQGHPSSSLHQSGTAIRG